MGNTKLSHTFKTGLMMKQRKMESVEKAYIDAFSKLQEFNELRVNYVTMTPYIMDGMTKILNILACAIVQKTDTVKKLTAALK